MDQSLAISNPAHELATRETGRWWPTLLACTLGLALLPFAANFITFHPDERHYTDGAAQMLATGDYLTPRTPEGYLRFNKPVLTYWLLVPWYHTLGISPLAGRISFLLITVAIVLMTHQTALLVYGNRRTALVAAAIMATHGPLISVAVSSIPEVPLTLCYLICAYGLLGIIICGRREALFYWAAYGGAGLGVAVKGMPILLLVGYAWAFALANPWRKTPVRELVHWPSMIAGAVVGLGWYAAMYALHGNESLAMFVSDQVTERVGLSLPVVLKNLGLVIICYLLAFFPWTLFVGTARRLVPQVRLGEPDLPGEPDRQGMLTFYFTLGWAVLMAVVVALVERFAARYLLAVTPLAAVVVADRLALQWGRLPACQFSVLGWSGYALAGVIMAGSVLMVVLRWQLYDHDLAWIAGGIVAAVGLWLCLSRDRWLPERFMRLTLAALALFPIAYLTLEPIALPDSGEVMARTLRDYRWLEKSRMAYVGSPAMVSKARVRMSGELPLIALSDYEDLAIIDYDALVLRAKDADCLPHENYRPAMSFTSGYEGVKPLEATQAIAGGRLKQYLSQHRQPYVLVVNGDRIDTNGYTFRPREKLR